jgi:hypothetical protein
MPRPRPIWVVIAPAASSLETIEKLTLFPSSRTYARRGCPAPSARSRTPVLQLRIAGISTTAKQKVINFIAPVKARHVGADADSLSANLFSQERMRREAAELCRRHPERYMAPESPDPGL